MKKVVFIGNNPVVADIAILSVYLGWLKVVAIEATTATRGLELVEQESPDVVLIHPDFTDMTLIQIIQDLRSFSNVPLLVLGYENDETEAVSSLTVGADDYVRSPYGLEEILARLLAIIRRRQA